MKFANSAAWARHVERVFRLLTAGCNTTCCKSCTAQLGSNVLGSGSLVVTGGIKAYFKRPAQTKVAKRWSNTFIG